MPLWVSSFFYYSRLTWLDEVMYIQEGRYAKPEQPTCIIVEAKWTSRLADASSEAELFGQIKSQLIRRYVPPQTFSHVVFCLFLLFFGD
jgi:hypothetical protein